MQKLGHGQLYLALLASNKSGYPQMCSLYVVHCNFCSHFVMILYCSFKSTNFSTKGFNLSALIFGEQISGE